MRARLLISVALLVLLATAISADVPTVMSYQGILTDPGGTPVPDASYSVVFTIYSAVTGGTVEWTETRLVSTSGGAFSLELGSVTTLGNDIFDGVDRYLGIKIGADPEISPRTRLATVPYAFNSGTGWTKTSDLTHLRNNGDKVAIRIDTLPSVAWAAPSLDVYRSGSWSGFWVGLKSTFDNPGTGGSTAGHFEYLPRSGGFTLNPGYGLMAIASTNSSQWVYGINSIASTNWSGGAIGGKFEVSANSETATARAQAIEISAIAQKTNWAIGIEGDVQSTGGPAYGVDLNVEATNNGATGMRMVVDGQLAVSGVDLTVNSTAATSTYGINSSATCNNGSITGVRSVINNSGSGDAVGVEAMAATSGTGMVTGVYVHASGNSTTAVYGVKADAVSNNGTGATYAIYGQVLSSGSGTHYGVFGYEAAGGSGAAVYASGDMIASGAKSAIVRTSRGQNLMYATEATELWFEDIGRGSLHNGSAHIELDALFLETVVIDANHPMEVFIQLRGDCKGTFVEVGTTGFDVIELQSGSSDASFTYRVMAKRKGYENDRMRSTDAGNMDVHLYPERAAEINAAMGRKIE